MTAIAIISGLLLVAQIATAGYVLHSHCDLTCGPIGRAAFACGRAWAIVRDIIDQPDADPSMIWLRRHEVAVKEWDAPVVIYTNGQNTFSYGNSTDLVKTN